MLGLKRAAVRWSVSVVINILELDGQQCADLRSVMIYWRVWPDLLLEGQGGNTVRQKEIVHFANGLHSTSVSVIDFVSHENGLTFSLFSKSERDQFSVHNHQ